MTNSPSDVHIVDEDPGPVGKGPTVSRTRLITILAIAFLVIGGGWVIWNSLHHQGLQRDVQTSVGPTGQVSATDQKDVREAASVAADYTVHRDAAIYPLFRENAPALPVYPSGTTMKLDQQTWVRFGESAGAEADVMPQKQRVVVLFSRDNGRWYVTQIKAKP